MRLSYVNIIFVRAGMSELADEADSKSVDGNIVWVQVPLPAYKRPQVSNRKSEVFFLRHIVFLNQQRTHPVPPGLRPPYLYILTLLFCNPSLTKNSRATVIIHLLLNPSSISLGVRMPAHRNKTTTEKSIMPGRILSATKAATIPNRDNSTNTISNVI